MYIGKLGFIGIGNMGEALLRGIISSGLMTPSDVLASDLNTEKLSALGSELGINTVGTNVDLVNRSDVVLLALKPNIIKTVLAEISSALTKPKWCISIAAGVRLKSIEDSLQSDTPVVRVMPNTPAMVSQGMAAISAGQYATEHHIDRTKSIMEAVGKAIVVPEKMMDAVTALSGSGPAFVFLIIEALTDAGVQLGLKRADAALMAAQTVLGASKMILDTGEHPAVLKNKVTSPGGTTAAGLYELESSSVRYAIISAVLSAAKRSEELSSS